MHPFFKRCKSLIQEMLRLKQQQMTMSKSDYARQTKSIETRLATLARQHYEEAGTWGIASQLANYRTRPTTFLHEDHVDGTYC